MRDGEPSRTAALAVPILGEHELPDGAWSWRSWTRSCALGFDEVEELGRREIRVRYLGLPAGETDGDAHVLRARVTRP